jgi:hypothetical protein
MIPHHPGIATNDHAGPTIKTFGVSDLPQVVTRDAFSHPALYHPSKTSATPPAEGLAGSLDGSPDISNVNAEDAGSDKKGAFHPLLVGAPPGENAGKGQQPEGKTTVRFCLKAVVQATKPLAMILITSDQNPTVQTFALGQAVSGGYQLTSIGPSGVVLTAKKRKPLSLEVGQEVESK